MAENYVFNNGLDDGGMGAIGRWATGWAQGNHSMQCSSLGHEMYVPLLAYTLNKTCDLIATLNDGSMLIIFHTAEVEQVHP